MAKKTGAKKTGKEAAGCVILIGILVVITIIGLVIQHPLVAIPFILFAITAFLLWHFTKSEPPTYGKVTTIQTRFDTFDSPPSPPPASPATFSTFASTEPPRPHQNSVASRPDRRPANPFHFHDAHAVNRRIYHSDIPTTDLTPGRTAILLDIDYADRNGEETRRRVRVQSLLKDDFNVLQFRGVCELRSDERTFSTRGILRLRDGDRTIPRNQTPTFIKDQHMLTKFGRTQAAIEATATLIDVLTHIAKASGSVSAAERKIIESVIIDHLGPNEPDEIRIKAAVRDSILSPNQFRNALSKTVREGGKDVLVLRSLVEDMSRLRTSSDPYTVAAIEIARKHLGRP